MASTKALGKDTGSGRLQGRPPFLQQLRPGPGLDQIEVAKNQRSRLRRAMVELLADRGYGALRIRALSQTAGVSTKTFYDRYADLDDCLAATFDRLAEHALREVSGVSRQSDWSTRTHAQVHTLMELIADDPPAARVVLLEIFAAGPSLNVHLRSATAKFEYLLAEQIVSAPQGLIAPRRLMAAIVSGVAHVARTTLSTGRADELPGLSAQLSDWIASLPSREILRLHRVNLDRPHASEAVTSGTPARLVAGRQRPYSDDRTRILDAVVKVARRVSVSDLTTGQILAEAEVTRRSFEAHFADFADCLFEAIEAQVISVANPEGRPGAAEADWKADVQAGVARFCHRMAIDQDLAKLTVAGVRAMGTAGIQREDRLIYKTASQIRAAVPLDSQPAPVPLAASISAAWSLARAELTAGRGRRLGQAESLFSYLILAPAVGPRASVESILAEAARRRLTWDTNEAGADLEAGPPAYGRR